MSLLSLFGLGSSQSLAPAPWNDYWYGPVGTQTAAGVRVDEQVAMNYSVCWAATRLLAGTTGWLPFNLYRRLPSGGSEIAKSHPVHRLIHDQPNGEMGAMMFRSRGVNHQVNWGNCYAEILRTGGGVPVGLLPIHPSRIPNANIKRENGKLVYYVRAPDGGNPEPVGQDNMFHVPSIISDDGVIGKGVITAAREAIGRAMGTQTRGSAALKNGGAPPMAIKGGKFKDKAERENTAGSWTKSTAGRKMPERCCCCRRNPKCKCSDSTCTILSSSSRSNSMWKTYAVGTVSRRIWCRTFSARRSTTSKNWVSAS
jgi:phage portal protein BeeE